MKSEIVPRRLTELEWFRGDVIREGDFLHVSEPRRKALLANPYLESRDAICQWVGFADGRPAGFNYSFPLHVWADGVVYRGTTGSCLNVEEWARKTDMGLVLPAKGVESASKDGIAIAAACSQMAVPLHQINGYKYFFYPRFIVLWHSRAVFQRFLPKWLACPLSILFDGFLFLYKSVLRGLSSCILHGYHVEAIEAGDKVACRTMAEIVSYDTHRFREDHDAAWFEWHTTCSFSENGPCKGWFLRSEAGGTPIAFAVTKRRHHDQASRRGYRDVWLCSFVEWGAIPGYERLLKWFVLSVALRYRKNCDAVEFAVDDRELASFFRKLGGRQVGEANVGVKVMKNFPFYGDNCIRMQSNWRIRPGMGDNALS